MAVILGTASHADIDTILRLWHDAAENRSRPADRRESLVVLLDRDPGALLTAHIDSDLVGTIIAGWDGWRCHLYRLAVRPDQRRLGVGRALVAAAEARGRRLGATRVDAMVLEDNPLGQRIWLAAGYTQQPDWRRWVKPLP